MFSGLAEASKKLKPLTRFDVFAGSVSPKFEIVLFIEVEPLVWNVISNPP